MPKNKKTPVVVLGMHRSGTSAVAGILQRIGISMGYRFLEADQFNPNGYYEDDDFLWINKGILENSGGTWFTPPSISDMQEGGEKFRTIIARTIAKRPDKDWGWKDPRTCLTCWSYMHAVPNAKFLVVVRTLSSIKRSLNTTHGHLANWDTVIAAYYNSVTEFLDTHNAVSLNVCFEELVYEKYARNAVLEILDFVGKPERLVDRALNVLKFR